MKYPRGTVLQWTKKALDPKKFGSAQRHPDDRLIVLSHDEAMFVHNGIIEQMDVYKTHDSFVEQAVSQTFPLKLRVDKAEVTRVRGQVLITEFQLQVTPKYEGRRR